jgi:deoxyhypusine synthase
LPGAHLRSKGLNRIGNLLVPNDNYCKFEDWIIPIFNQMLKEQNNEVFYFVLFPRLQILYGSLFVEVFKTGWTHVWSEKPREPVFKLLLYGA